VTVEVMMLPVASCAMVQEPHDHIGCRRFAWMFAHDHDDCKTLLLELRPSQRMCTVADDETHGTASHAVRGYAGGVLPRCEECFLDVYGPHDCRALDCPSKPWPCTEVGKTPEVEA
jgi:hypothetical protein